MGLYQKHRPTSFEGVIGNESTVKSLQAQLKGESVPSAFLFAGPSGCGKTTLGRIVVSEMGCSETDFTELDTADFTGVDNIRRIRRTMSFLPMDGDVRCWLLDECHELSAQAQDALLKGLEDPPPHAHFVLCTTNPEKLKPTLRNRCSTYTVKELSPKQIGSILIRVCKAERKKPPMEVLKRISIDCMGSARMGLVILEQIIGLPNEDMLSSVNKVVEEQVETKKLMTALLKNAPFKKVAAIAKDLKGEPESVRRNVLGYMRAVLLNSGSGRAYEIMDCFAENYFDTGAAGLAMSCWEACNVEASS